MVTLIEESPSTASQSLNSGSQFKACWPEKRTIFGVQISETTYDDAVRATIHAAQHHIPSVVSCHAVHALMTFSNDPELREIANSFDMITPDGQPVRWALNLLHGAGLKDRVYGPELTLRLCEAAAEHKVLVYLYGGSPDVAAKLPERLKALFPELEIAGYESPPYRELTDAELEDVAERINASKAGLVFIGLGCPKQDIFAHRIRKHLNAVQVCVGAAFDFHAGVKETAPSWMQKLGLEWLFRLVKEPKRLWRRYLVTNTQYLAKLALSLANIPRVLRQRARKQ
ncbi:WecB/TagA/CpsF family glycosyltransferase [Thalassoroseus pseudoceratinae]|uniref:WecB/TagA/CpsF family glycosyltransferase n=1 Tax=Thalassoroseus pseudoceratinae TaxID=2713176 RepID=UPI00142076AC|nr:WecB/TagA/CpsF family glycosyltransferase [Thalassoroseus pseudoceratinae]